MELLVLSGGQHPYGESTPVLEKFLKVAGHAVEVTENHLLTFGRRRGLGQRKRIEPHGDRRSGRDIKLNRAGIGFWRNDYAVF